MWFSHFLAISSIVCAGIAGVYAEDIIPYADHSPVIDGKDTDPVWMKSDWQPLNHSIIGDLPPEGDFSGRFKLLWGRDQLYILADIADDILFDRYADPKERYWDDDCLEVFIDEDASGGDHLNNHNAFAYHIGLDNQAVDMGELNDDGSSSILLLNDHVRSVWKRNASGENRITWEVALKLYDNSFNQAPEKIAEQTPVELHEGKEIGFMLAYCDNDGGEAREHFVGSKDITPVAGDKNLGYKDASVFSKFILGRRTSRVASPEKRSNEAKK